MSLTKTYSHDRKLIREVFYLVGMLRTPSLVGDSISVALRKLLQGGGEGRGSGCIQVCNNGSRRPEQQRSGISEGIEHSTYGRMQASGLTEFIHAFHMHLSCLGKSCSLFTLLLFSCSVVSDSLQPHGPQHARPPCSSPSPGACSNSCPSSR